MTEEVFGKNADSAVWVVVQSQWGLKTGEVEGVRLTMYETSDHKSRKVERTVTKRWNWVSGRLTQEGRSYYETDSAQYTVEGQAGQTRTEITNYALKIGVFKAPPNCEISTPIDDVKTKLKPGDDFASLEIYLAPEYSGTLYHWSYACKRLDETKIDDVTKHFFAFADWLKKNYFEFPPSSWTRKDEFHNGKHTQAERPSH